MNAMAEPIAVLRLALTDFRNYAHIVLDADARPLVLTGANGAGKTNLLEAVSLLVPGRGLRGAGFDALARAGGSGGWAVSARLDADDIVQSVFRTFFRRVADGCYDVPPGDELWQLLLVLALNKIRSQATYHRAKKRDVGATVSAEQVAGASDASRGDDERSLQILELTVEEALHELPPSHQQMIRMRIEGHSVQEIADETERAKRSVERVLKNFRDRMQKLVQDSPDSDNHESHEP